MNQQDIRLNIVLHANQQHIEDSLATYKAIKTGKRFGKTWWAIYALLKRGLRKPGGVFWYTAPTYRQAKSIAWYTLKWMLPPQLIKRAVETELMIETKNDVRFELKGEENEDSLRGIPIDGLVRDECALNPRGDYAWSILHGQMIGRNGFAYHISSPNPNGRNWYTNFCADYEQKMKAGDPNYFYAYHTIYDNPTLRPEEIDQLKAGMPDSRWDLEYLALESAHAGQLYSEFSEEKNVVDHDLDIKGGCYRGLDWGLNHPAAVLWAKADYEKKIVYIYDEFVKSGLVTEEIVRAAVQKTGNVPVEWNVIDPSANKRDPNTKRRLIDEYARYGMGCIPGDNRDRGYDISKMFMKKGMLKIHRRCKNLISEIRNVQWGDKTGEDTLDAMRYLLTRLHDVFFQGNLFEHEAEEPSFKDTGIISFKNPLLFPQNPTGSSWAMNDYV